MVMYLLTRDKLVLKGGGSATLSVCFVKMDVKQIKLH